MRSSTHCKLIIPLFLAALLLSAPALAEEPEAPGDRDGHVDLFDDDVEETGTGWSRCSTM